MVPAFLALVNLALLFEVGLSLPGLTWFARPLSSHRPLLPVPRASAGSGEPDSLQEALFRKEIESARTGTWLDSVATLPFECTECGKCCRTIGSVYMDPEEIVVAARYMNHTVPDFIESCASSEVEGAGDSELPWILVKNKETELGPACHFLDTETNRCTIYPVRPIQCSTYPFWSNIMSTRRHWNNEVRRAEDDEDATLAPWTAEGGGCEGLKVLDDGNTCPDAFGVPTELALEQLILYERNDRRLPRRQG